MSDEKAEFSRFIPRLLQTRLATAPGRPHDSAESIEVAALWLDISGFTPLTSRFAEEGPRGAEIVGEILDRIYSALIERITAAGGDVLDFAGDGVLAVWLAEPGTATDATRRASRCALAIQKEMDHFEVGREAEIRFYAGIGAGPVTLLDVGGVDGRWRFLVAGAPLEQIAQATQECSAGEVVLSPEAYALLADSAGGTPRALGTFKLTSLSDQEAEQSLLEPVELEVDTARVRPYLIESVLRRIDAGQTAWLAEFRHTSILFVVVPEVDVKDPAGCDAIRTAVHVAQTRISALGGSLNQVLMDDNGLVILAAWGVPDRTHEDDARRAMLAAVEIRVALGEAGLAVRSGVATGRVFCGAVGNKIRSRYALVGEAVNRAARIAMASPGSARCDGNTRDGAARWLQFSKSETLTLKGIDESVPLYTMSGSRSPVETGSPDDSDEHTKDRQISGRQQERQLLEEALRNTSEAAGHPLMLLEGEAGIGKSVLLGNFGAVATDSGWHVYTAAADAVEESTAYFPWRELFRALFEIDPALPPEQERQRVVEQLSGLPASQDRIPLLEPMLGLGFEENDITAAMSGRDRGPAARELASSAFDLLAGPAPLLLLEDLHWFDSASIELIEAIRARTPRVLVAATTRPPTGNSLPQLIELAEAAGTLRIPLVEMDGTEVLTMVQSGLGVADLPEALVDLLMERGEGHPLFTMELALLLRELGIVRVVGHQCEFDPEDPRLAALSFPEKAEGVVASRIDQLDPSHQLALKVAAVIGRSFEHQLLRDVYPIEEERGGLRQMLDTLTRPRLIEEEQADPALAYLFRHVVIREVAYGLASFAQRRQLHAEIARSLESESASEIAGNLPLLAHHWQMAEEPGPAITYLRRAGEQALHRGAGHEALRFFQDALVIANREEGLIEEATPLKLADLERLSGEAHEQLLNLAESSRWLTLAIERLGYEVPVSDSRRRRALVLQSLNQIGHIIWPNSLRRRPTPEQAAGYELAASAYSLMAEHCYFESDLMGMVLLSLMAVNLAERGQSPDAAERSYLTLTQTVGLMGITPLVKRYSARSADSKQGRNQSFREIEHGGRLLATGQLEEAAAAGARAASLAQRYADRHHEAQGWGIVVSAELRQGNADRGVEAAERMIPIGHLDWSYTAQATAAVLSGRPADAIERVAKMQSWEPAFALGHLTMRILWAEEQGDLTLADECASVALAEVESPGLKNAFTVGHYANLLAYYSRRYHGLPLEDANQRETVIGNVRRLHSELKRFCRLFPIGRPRLEQAAAILALHAGDKSKGARHIERGLALAKEYAMQPEVVALNLELARWHLPGTPQALSLSRELCHDKGLDRLLMEVESVSV